MGFLLGSRDRKWQGSESLHYGAQQKLSVAPAEIKSGLHPLGFGQPVQNRLVVVENRRNYPAPESVIDRAPPLIHAHAGVGAGATAAGRAEVLGVIGSRTGEGGEEFAQVLALTLGTVDLLVTFAQKFFEALFAFVAGVFKNRHGDWLGSRAASSFRNGKTG